MTMKRRSFLIGAGAGAVAAAMPFDLWRKKRAQAAGPYIRYSTASAEGAAMLQTYAKAVAAMKALPTSDPRSWVFQWYTHWVDGNTTKDAAIQAAYGSTSSPQRDLAEAMWNTCQGHGENPVEYFVVWHRMFVFYFEEIVRAVSGDDSFTLPYWPYDQPDQQTIPVAFRSSGNNPLYVENRNPGINAGDALGADGRSPLGFKCMTDKTFLPSLGSLSRGFNYNLNQDPHGTVHVDVGTTTNMGRIPYAAQDPVFYVHHCEIDRLWASWNAAGGKNTADDKWMDQTFVFADANGTMVKATNRDFLSTEALGYKYDTLMDIAPIESPAAMVMAKSAEAPLVLSVGAAAAPEKHGVGGNMLHAEIEGALSLGEQPLTVKIPQPKSMPLMGTLNKSLGQSERKVFVVLRDIYAAQPPGSAFGVYINLPAGTTPSPKDPHYVGSINFFNATAMPGSKGMFMVDTYVLDVTEDLKKLSADKGLGEDISVTVAPFGKVNAAAAAKVGRIEFVIE
jgi:tyrosinase